MILIWQLTLTLKKDFNLQGQQYPFFINFKKTIMEKLNLTEKKLLDNILQYAVNSDDYESYAPVIQNIYTKLNLNK